MNPILLFIFTKLASILGLLGAIAIIILWLLLHGQHETSFILLCITLGLTTTVTLLKKVLRYLDQQAPPSPFLVTPSRAATPPVPPFWQWF